MHGESLEVHFARRDSMAYETAYRRFGPRMVRTAMRLLHDLETANDCVHDVFADLWRKRTAYSAARGSLEAFLVTCTRNRALMHLRSGDRGLRAAKKLAPEQEYRMDEDPIERERVHRALAQLGDGEAAVIRLAYYRGMTLSEVAAELAIPLGTVKGRLSSALRRLRATLLPEKHYGI